MVCSSTENQPRTVAPPHPRADMAPLQRRLVLLLLAAGLGACTEPARNGWSGYAEGEYVYMASSLGGTLQELAVQAGQNVTRGSLLFALDDRAERAASQEAQARLGGAQAQADNLGKSRRADEIAVTQAQLAQARVQAELARKDLARQQQLVEQGFISKSRLDDARSAVGQADAHVGELEAALRVAHLPARVDERQAAKAQAQAAEQALRQSQWREQQKQVSAPVDARVADTYFRVGEYVAPGQPVLALLPPANIKARFFVPETQIATLATGQGVTLHCDGCGAPIAARVSFIATQAEYTPPVIYSNSQRARLVFLVEARPAPADAPRLRPGQPLDVRQVAANAP
jgi:HlyD family secretion protein